MRPSPDTIAASASWRNAVSLALTEVVTVSPREIWMVTAVVEACDQVLLQAASVNWPAIVRLEKFLTSAAVRVAGAGIARREVEGVHERLGCGGLGVGHAPSRIGPAPVLMPANSAARSRRS